MMSSLSAETVSDILRNIPKHDQEDLRRLFATLIDRGHFGYTLFGDKPVSWISYSITGLPKLNFCKKGNQGLVCLTKDSLFSTWNTWKKYQSLFVFKNYLFIEETPCSYLNLRHIFLINKESFIKIVNTNIDLFQCILDKKITAEGLLKEIERSGQFRPNIHHSEVLLGILLGYGKHNAMLYQQREDISLLYKQYKSMLFKDAGTLKDLNQKADALTDILQPFGSPNIFPQLVRSVQFVANAKHPETLDLQKKYQTLKEEIAQIYSQSDLVEITLSTLMR